MIRGLILPLCSFRLNLIIKSERSFYTIYYYRPLVDIGTKIITPPHYPHIPHHTTYNNLINHDDCNPLSPGSNQNGPSFRSSWVLSHPRHTYRSSLSLVARSDRRHTCVPRGADEASSEYITTSGRYSFKRWRE